MPCPCTNNTIIENNCGCSQPTCQETSCACAVYISSDCVNDVKAEFTCLPIESHLTLTQTLEAMDSAICDKFDEFDSHFQLTNTGTGAEVYKGVNLLGQKEIRKINAVGDLITVTQNTNDMSISIDETELETFVEDLIPNYNSENLGAGAEVFKEETANTFKFRTITSTDNSVTITEGTNTIDLSVEATTPTDINITGAGATIVTEPTPNNFVVTSTDTDTIVELQDGTTTEVNGDGVTTPYSVEVLNLQKRINFPNGVTNYTLVDGDFAFTLFLNNLAKDVTITVPATLLDYFICQFYQEGTGNVTFVGSGGATINTPTGLKIKGQFYWCAVEKILTSTTFGLVGSLKL